MDQAPPASDLQSPSSLAQNTVVASSSGTSNVPVGAMTMYAASTPPSGWLVCDGSSLNRTTYASLFAILGVTYGNVDGATFNLPDLRGRVPVCLGTNASVSALATSDGQAVANRRPQHRTTDAKTVAIGTLAVNPSSHDHQAATKWTNNGAGGGAGQDWLNTQGDNSAAPRSGSTSLSVTGAPTLGGSIGTNNANDALDAPSFLVVNFIIKY